MTLSITNKFITMRKIILLCLTTTVLYSCVGRGEYDKTIKQRDSLDVELKELQDEYCKVVTNNEQLHQSLDSVYNELKYYQLSPAKLCADIDLLLKNRDSLKLREIETVLQKYHPESKELQKVSSYRKQIDAQIRKEKEAEKRKRLQAVNRLIKKKDEMSSFIWYFNPYFTHYENTNRVSIYISKISDLMWLRMKMSYTGDDWIFFENAYLSYDGNTKGISFDKYKEKESDNSGGEVWEWIDIAVEDDLLEFLRAMVNGKSVKMRLSGKYSKTRDLSVNEIKAIKDVLLAYDVLKEELGKSE